MIVALTTTVLCIVSCAPLNQEGIETAHQPQLSVVNLSTVQFKSVRGPPLTYVHHSLLQEVPQKAPGVKPEDSTMGNGLREYEALAKEVKILRQAVDTR